MLAELEVSCSDYGWICEPRLAWPATEDVAGGDTGRLSGFRSRSRPRSPPHLHRPTGPSTCLSSDITAVKTVGSRDSPRAAWLITTLGSDRCGATVNVLDLAEPFQFLARLGPL
ncbi:hypothetical protein MLD38_014612 [Melastoma candidum]|uniref:Uncharacterized protein n=1 Tax=Melastoma candidum TaxID=119954 RepID=A0ACB9RD88_9MYRT|nr:hypothetical protein MLD38_014612 [Melastoma candidum]